MLKVYWLEQKSGGVPAGDDWLCPAEVALQNRLRVVKRRTDWRLGRWTAKLAVAGCLQWPCDNVVLKRIEICPAPDGAPQVTVLGHPGPLTLSISHRAGLAACAVALCQAALGCDVELIEPRDGAFLRDYFNSTERQQVLDAIPMDRPGLVTLFWSAKESALKALREGLRMDPREVSVNLDWHDGSPAWSPLQTVCPNGRILHGWWRHSGGVTRTLVAEPHPDRPDTLV